MVLVKIEVAFCLLLVASVHTVKGDTNHDSIEAVEEEEASERDQS